MSQSEAGGVTESCLQEWIGNRGPDSLPEQTPRQLMKLSRTIEGEIIPRLMMLLDPGIDTRESRPEVRTTSPGLQNRTDELVQLLLRHDASVAAQFVDNLRASGNPLTSIYLDLLAPAARRLGVMWENDECTFTEVTVGVARMHQLLLQFSPCFCANRGEDADGGHSALIVPVPGEQHTFGLFMVVEFFRREGWNVWSGSPSSQKELLELISCTRFDVVGCSVSADRNLSSLALQISEMRKHSKNPKIKVILGGRVLTENPELCKFVGADATALDGKDAVRLAEELVSRA